MSKEQLIRPQTVAESTGVEFDKPYASYYTLVSSGLAGAEEVDIEVFNGNGWSPFVSNDGDVVTLTATQTMYVLPGGPRYRVKKDVTVGAAGVVVYWT